jgi:hypothetical protein
MTINLRDRWAKLGVPYVAVVALVVAAALATNNGRFYLVALILTLPLGAIAIVGVYLVYGLLVQIVGALGNGLPEASVESLALAISGLLNVLLFAVAATGNLLLLRSVLSRRARRQQLLSSTPRSD